ncbi:NADH-quinone oxidoreductase subunit 5 [bacterium HR24]|nr:NADH-quinone oxidoreductase subunit 5 [bacterium HR24]
MSDGTTTGQSLPPVLERLREAVPDISFEYVPTPLDPAVVVSRDELLRFMTALKEDERLAFDYLRCLSGVDYIDELEVVYHLRSFRHGHTLAVKVKMPADDPHVPSVAHIWRAADWHERETWEMFGIVFEGHPDLRPLLTEEGLGYYPLRKSHPLAEIEDWQESLLERVEKLAAAAAPAGAPEAAVDEKAQKVAMAQKKAEVIKKAREEARAKGLPPEEERKYVQEAIKRFEEEMAKEAAAPAPAAARPAAGDERAQKVAMAQKKAEVIKKAREEARAKGLSGEEERQYVQQAVKRFEEEMAGAAAPPAPQPQRPAAEGKAPLSAADKAARIALAQKKAEVIKKAREEARAKGLSGEEERQYVQEALRRLEQEGEGG